MYQDIYITQIYIRYIALSYIYQIIYLYVYICKITENINRCKNLSIYAHRNINQHSKAEKF